MLILWVEALVVLSGANRGGVRLRIVDISSEIFWVPFLVSTLGSPLWWMVCVEFPRLVKLVLLMGIS